MDFIRSFKQIGNLDIEAIGHKLQDLLLLSEQHFNTPVGFVILNRALQAFIDENDMRPKLRTLLDSINLQNDTSLSSAYNSIRQLFHGSHVPDRVMNEILEAVDGLVMDESASIHELMSETYEPNVALLLSVDHVLEIDHNEGIVQNIMGKDELAQGLKECWASAFTPNMLRNRTNGGLPNAGVFLYRMQSARAAGIATSWQSCPHISAQTYAGHLDIEERIKGDSFLVSKEYLTIERSSIGRQSVKLAVSNHQFERVSLGVHGEQQKINDKLVMELARLAKRSEQLLQTSVRLWFYFKDDVPVLVQVQRLAELPPAELMQENQGSMASSTQILESEPAPTEETKQDQIDSQETPGLTGAVPNQKGISDPLLDTEEHGADVEQIKDDLPEDLSDAFQDKQDSAFSGIQNIVDDKVEESGEESLLEEPIAMATNVDENIIKQQDTTNTPSFEHDEEQTPPSPHEEQSSEARKEQEEHNSAQTPISETSSPQENTSPIEEEQDISAPTNQEPRSESSTSEEIDSSKSEEEPATSLTKVVSSSEDEDSDEEEDNEYEEVEESDDTGEENVENDEEDEDDENPDDEEELDKDNNEEDDNEDSDDDDEYEEVEEDEDHDEEEDPEEDEDENLEDDDEETDDDEYEEVDEEDEDGEETEEVDDEEEDPDDEEEDVDEFEEDDNEDSDDDDKYEEVEENEDTEELDNENDENEEVSDAKTTKEPLETFQELDSPDEFILGAQMEAHNPLITAKKGLVKLVKTLEIILQQKFKGDNFASLVDHSTLNDEHKANLKQAKALALSAERGEDAQLNDYIDSMHICSEILGELI